MKSRICEILGIKYPIFQGGMAWVSTYHLASAVSNAGGVGIIAAGGANGEYVREQIRKTRELTKKPFGINIMLMSPFADEVMKVVMEERVPMITTGAGNPGKYIKDLKKCGIKVLPVVASVALAKRLEQEGVDGLIAEGTESGGHVGELTTMCIVPQVVDAVKIPVLAAGGIADGRGMLAAFALGAEGIQMGTRFVCSKECFVHKNYKEALLNARDRDTIVTGRSTGHPVRCIKNKLTREFDRIEANRASIEEIEELGRGTLKMAAVDGDITNGSVMSGQIAGNIKEIKSVSEIINDIIFEYNCILKGLKE